MRQPRTRYAVIASFLLILAAAKCLGHIFVQAELLRSATSGLTMTEEQAQRTEERLGQSKSVEKLRELAISQSRTGQSMSQLTLSTTKNTKDWSIVLGVILLALFGIMVFLYRQTAPRHAGEASSAF